MSWLVRVIPNRYADSVRLMSVARDVRAMDGVDACEIGMGTPANLETLAALGAQADSGPADLVIAVQVADGVGEDAVAAAERALASTSANGTAAAGPAPPRSLPAAAREAGDAGVALISVPGEYATLGRTALPARTASFSSPITSRGRRCAQAPRRWRGLLVMGPECGTAMLARVGLGLANVVRQGGDRRRRHGGHRSRACSTTPAAAGRIIGVGGRDLSTAVGGTTRALRCSRATRPPRRCCWWPRARRSTRSATPPEGMRAVRRSSAGGRAPRLGGSPHAGGRRAGAAGAAAPGCELE